ncbi:MAG: PIN domain-containing protein [Candidatus Sumerlaeota bacterium]|nr:PIN domain-containing protein [Candidatus Sumerlaeota bacterium]
MKITLDINVLADVLQERLPYCELSTRVLNLAFSGSVEAFIPSHALTTLYYILKKRSGREQAEKAVDHLLQHFAISISDKALFLQARSLAIRDFEDAVIASSAAREQCDKIITRNVDDFQNSPIPAMTPEDFLSAFFPEEQAT